MSRRRQLPETGVRLRLVALVAVTAVSVTAGTAATPSASARSQPVVRPSQELATLLTSHQVVARLRVGGAPVGRVRASRPVTGGQTVLPVIRHTTWRGVHWLQVRIPGRPNSRKGWIRRRGTVETTTGWHLVVRTSLRRVLVYRRGRLVRTFSAIVGKPSTPTPHGHFFVEESVRMLPGSAGAPFALALSARSNVLQEFEGGPGQIALHGLGGVGGTPGTAVSHGCVRLANRNIGWLAARIPPGVTVSIRR